VGIAVDPADSTVRIQNTGGSNAPATIDMGKWVVLVGTTSVVLPSQTRLAPLETLVIHTGADTSPTATASVAGERPALDDGTPIYLGSSGSALGAALQPGAEVSLLDDRGAVVSVFVVSG